MTRDDQIAEALAERHRAFLGMLSGHGMQAFLAANARYLALKRPAVAAPPRALPRKRRRMQPAVETQLKLL